MYASIRSYRLNSGSMAETMHLVDTEFADQIAGSPGFVAYHAVDCGDNTLCTVTVFQDEASAEQSVDAAAEFVQNHQLDITRTDVKVGKVDVSRAASEVLEPAHA